MAQPSSNNPILLPTWLLVLGSLAIAGHLLVFAVSVLAAPSGRWWTPLGPDMALGPEFALSIDMVTRPNYLRPLKMTHNYHFDTNRAETPGVYLEVRLKDESGAVKDTLRFPEKDANAWVRHRQGLLAWHLLQGDQPVAPPAGEVIPAPGQRADVQFWDMAQGDRIARLRTVPQHLVPRDRPVFRPSELSLVLARSYARHLCRAHGAASAEIIRHSKDQLSPVVLIQADVPGATEEFVASFGELPRETPP